MPITNEDKAKYFPLLDDMGGMEEIYTIEEFRSRLSATIYMPKDANYLAWKSKWCKGIVSERNSFWDSHDLYYCGVLVGRKFHDGHITWYYGQEDPILTNSKKTS